MGGGSYASSGAGVQTTPEKSAGGQCLYGFQEVEKNEKRFFRHNFTLNRGGFGVVFGQKFEKFKKFSGVEKRELAYVSDHFCGDTAN